jgi:hypothetical protein
VNGIVRLYRFDPKVNYAGDAVLLPNSRAYRPAEAANFNFGETKGAKLRYPVLLRRRKAWERGLGRSTGAHYETGASRDWQWNPKSLLDLRDTPFGELALSLAARLETRLNLESPNTASANRGDAPMDRDSRQR